MAMSAYLISKAALITDVSELSLAITSVRLFAILRAVFRYLERYFSHTATFRILTHLRVWFYSAIEPLAPARLMRLSQRRSADAQRGRHRNAGELLHPRGGAAHRGRVRGDAWPACILGAFDGTLALALLIFLLLTGVALP